MASSEDEELLPEESDDIEEILLRELEENSDS
jgi:hypothetical protein